MEVSHIVGGDPISQKCLECKEKDEIISKYERLVLLLKTKVSKHRTKSSSFFGLESPMPKRDSHNLASPKKENIVYPSTHLHEKALQRFHLRQNRESVDSIGNEFAQLKIKNMQQKPSKERFSISNQLFQTAPCFFNRPRNSITNKRISLSSEWLTKFTQLKSELGRKEKRINLLTDQLFSLKNEMMCIRGIFIQLLKSMKIKDLGHYQKQKVQLDCQGKEIIILIINLFEYSEEEMNQALGNGEQLRIDHFPVTSAKIDQDKSVYLPMAIKQMR